MIDLTDVLPEYFVISIPAFHDEINQSIDEWLYMMKHEEIQETFKEKYIRLAAERLNYLKMTMEEKANYERYQLEMVDVREEFRTQYIKGKIEGEAKGIAFAVKSMCSNNIAEDQIANILKLTIDEVKNILNHSDKR